MTLEIDPYIYGKKIGTILYKDGRIYFEYDEAFRASRLEISPVKLPLSLINAYSNRDELHYYEGLPGIFHDSLPDKFGTRIIEGYFESRGTPTHKLNIIQKLMFVGNKGMGAISYRPSENLIDRATCKFKTHQPANSLYKQNHQFKKTKKLFNLPSQPFLLNFY